jgi:N-acetylglucosaminyldiphosphoundecaprenol N-acetyl-beta-D-mannosaminyltransferase
VSGSAGAVRQSQLMGVSIDAVTEEQVIDRVLDGAASGSGGWICPVNLDVLRQCVQTEAVRELVQSADMVVADGMPVLWASRAAGEPLPERVAGSSLTFTLTAAAAERGASVYLLGGSPGAVDGAALRLKEKYPTLQVAGTACPSFGFEHDELQIAAIERDLEATNPDIVFVALGFPKQDRLAVRLRERFPRTWFVSCGISLSFASGQIQRAPRALQVLGLEWLHRLARQPRTLFRRYLVVGPPFAVRLMLTALARRFAKRCGGTQPDP